MNAIQLFLLILSLLRSLRSAESQEAFDATPAVQAIGDGQLGRWLWENREEIIKFIVTLIGMFSGAEKQDVVKALGIDE